MPRRVSVQKPFCLKINELLTRARIMFVYNVNFNRSSQYLLIDKIAVYELLAFKVYDMLNNRFYHDYFIYTSFFKHLKRKYESKLYPSARYRQTNDHRHANYFYIRIFTIVLFSGQNKIWLCLDKASRIRI